MTDIDRRINEEASRHVAMYTVSFGRYPSRSTVGHSPNPVCAGSGILIASNGRRAILSADHVLREFRRNEEIVLVPSSARPTRQLIQTERWQLKRIGLATDTIAGPDLSLALLSDIDADRISDGLSVFYNLDQRADAMKRDPPVNDGHGYLICGAIGEWSSAPPEDRGDRWLQAFSTLAWGGDMFDYDRARACDFDYFSLSVDEDGTYLNELPCTLKGWSGAGVWRVTARVQDTEPSIQHRYLCGVAFYEFNTSNGARAIRCHGFHSIYERVIRVMRDPASCP
jgi:hypothetical protein